MVKKIRLIDEEQPEESSPTEGMPAGNEWLELAKSMDWKLWEILQLLQRVEKKLEVAAEKETKDAKTKK